MAAADVEVERMCEPNRERGLADDRNDKGGMGGTGDVGDVARGVVEGERDKLGAGVRDRGLSSQRQVKLSSSSCSILNVNIGTRLLYLGRRYVVYKE